jgi:hypothetical protein
LPLIYFPCLISISYSSIHRFRIRFFSVATFSFNQLSHLTKMLMWRTIERPFKSDSTTLMEILVNGECARTNGSCEKEDENESFCCADRPRQMEKQQLCNYRCSTSTYICRTIQSKPTDFSCLDYTRYFGPLYQVMF